MARSDEKLGSRLGTLSAGLALCLSLYVLSYGPAIALHDRGYIGPDKVARAYYPLMLLCKNSSTAASALVWYSDLWLR